MAFLNKYGVARHIYIAIPKAGSASHAVGADWTPVAGDVKISKDGGAAANVTNLPSAIAMGNSAIWDFSLTATEMQAAQVVVIVADSATKAVDDTGFEVETYGNASAQHAVDLSDSVRAGLTALPNAAAEASGGLPTLSAAQASNGTINANVHRWLTGTPLALSSQQVQAIVPDTQKVDVNTIKTQTVTCAAGVTVNVNVGTTQPINFHGTSSSAYVKTDVVEVLDTAASTGVVDANMTQINGTSIAGTGSRVADGFVTMLNVASPVFTLTSVNQTGDSFARIGAPVGASISADISGVQSDTNDIQTRLPTALTAGGNIKADALKVNGATPNDLSAAGVRTAVGLATANLDTQLDALPTATENATAVLSAAASAPIAANVKKVNDTTVTGSGTSGDPWGP